MTFTSHPIGEFWKRYDALPAEIQEQADKQYTLFQTNPSHPSLHFKRPVLTGQCESAADIVPWRSVEGAIFTGSGLALMTSTSKYSKGKARATFPFRDILRPMKLKALSRRAIVRV